MNGTVTDPSGAAIPNVQVKAIRTGTGETSSTVSSGSGTYVFPSLSPAEYTITASISGFSTYEQKGVILQADQTVTINIGMTIGSEGETISVSAGAPQVDTSSSTLSQVIDQRRVNDLPLNGRNAASLTTLVAGVVVAPNAQADQGVTKTFPSVVTVSANGTRANQTNYMLDGGNNVDEYTNVNAPFPFPDALQEFSVQTSNYNAEYGQNAGGVVNIITKSGTNEYHGDLFEYVRNRVFNAANYFSYQNNVKVVDPLKRNQFGGTVGGPVRILHLYDGRDKSFFFVGYQRTLINTVASASTASILPTDSQLAGNFTQGSCVTNPKAAGPAFPCVNNGNGTYTTTISPSYFSTPSLNLLKYLPAGGSTGSYIYRKPTIQNYHEGTGRFDQQIGARDRASARYFYDSFHNNGVLDTSNLLTYSDQADISYHNALISETHTFSDRLLNNFNVSYQLENATRGPLSGSPDMNDLGVDIWQPSTKQINGITVSGLFTVGDNPQGSFRRSNYTLNDDLHYIVGSHSLAFGFHGEISKIDVDNLYRQPGVFNFNANGSGSGMANFLLGNLYQFQQASGQFFNNRGKFFGFYAQDSWKVNSRLTLNYGVRYEPYIPWHEKENRIGAFSLSAWEAGTHSSIFPNAPIGLIFPGDQGFIKDGIDKKWTDFMPRVGFALDVFGNGKTSLRGGGGMFYESRPSGVFNNVFSNSSPFVTSVDVTFANNAPGDFANPYATMTNPFPAQQPPSSTAAVPAQTFVSFDPINGFHVPVFYGWNLAVEQQIANDLSTRIAYVGTHGSHQWAAQDMNSIDINIANNTNRFYQYNPSGVATGLTQQLAFVNTGGNTSYHSLQLSVQKRMSHGISLLANYTWSKAMDNLPYGAAATSVATGNSYALPTYMPNYKSLDSGPSDFDHRNVVSMSYVWAFPQLKSGPRAVRYVINDWQTNGIFAFRSGAPLTVLSNVNNSGSQQNRDRAVQLGAPYGGASCGTSVHCKSYLNTASFIANPTGTFGTVGKGSYFGPQYTDWDVSLMRYLNFTENIKLQFRAEYFNVLNHTNFSDPTTTLGSNFGQITGANDPRIGQLSLKLMF